MLLRWHDFIYVVYKKIFLNNLLGDKKIVLTFVAENNSQQQQNTNIMKTNYISFADAVKRFNNSLILCNNIEQIDATIRDNMQFSLEDEDGNYREIMQYFITDCTSEDVKYLSDWFGLLFTFSELLDCYILCVDHWGTSWNSVMIEDKSPRF